MILFSGPSVCGPWTVREESSSNTGSGGPASRSKKTNFDDGIGEVGVRLPTAVLKSVRKITPEDITNRWWQKSRIFLKIKPRSPSSENKIIHNTGHESLQGVLKILSQTLRMDSSLQNKKRLYKQMWITTCPQPYGFLSLELPRTIEHLQYKLDSLTDKKSKELEVKVF